MRALDLRKLNHAIVLAEETTFVRASKRLHISQPALTRSIQSLEKELELVLFDRQLSGAIPTPQGEIVLEKARQLLQQSQLLRKEISLLTGQDTGQLSFGMGVGIQNPLLNHLLIAIDQHTSLSSVEIEIEPIAVLLALLRQKKIEFFVGDKGQIKPAERKRLALQKLTLSHGSFFARRDHPLAALADFPLEEISAFPRVAARVDDNEWRQQGKFEREYMNTNRVRRGIVCNDIAALISMTLNTNAILATTSDMVSNELAAGTIKELRFKNPGFATEREICLVTIPGRTLSNSAKLILKLIDDIIQNHYAGSGIANPR